MDTENKHQIALRKWIDAGLHIPEVAELNGDAGYIFNNMIAKYTLAADEYCISERALEKLNKNKVNLKEIHFRRKFYGKDKPFIYEHSTPATVIRDALLNSDKSNETIKRILSEAGSVTMILRDEDILLKKAGLNARMPEEWAMGDATNTRYKEAGIVISNIKLKVKGAIVR